MTKNKIEWHETNLKNMQSYYERESKVLEEQQKKVSQLKESIDFLNFQIQQAIMKGMIPFDAEKFCKSTKKALQEK